MITAHRIGPLEDKLLVLLARYVRATAEQLTRHSWSPNSIRYVRKGLARLVEAGYIDANTGFSQSGKPPYVYSPTMLGWRYAEEHHGMPIPARWRPSEARITDYRDYLHDLAITDTGIAIERFCREADPLVTFVRFLHDRFLPQTRIPLPDGMSPAIRLDAFVELHLRRDDSGRKKQRCHLIEIDRGTHSETALKQKLALQLRYVEDGHYLRDFGTQSLTYLWVCPGGGERATYVRRLAETVLAELDAVDFAPLFLFTGEDPAIADPIALFTAPIWVTPFAPATVALLAFPPSSTTLRLDRTHYLSPEDYDQFLRATGESVPIIAPELEVV